MNRVGLATVLALLVSPAMAVEPGNPAPAFELGTRNGTESGLDSLGQGGPVLLDFGSVYCAPCREVLGWLEQAQTRYRPQGLRVAAVNVDGTKFLTAVNRVCDNLGVTYPVLMDDDGSVAEAYGVDAIPYLVFIDASGTVGAVHIGRAPDLAAALGLDSLLAAQEEQR